MMAPLIGIVTVLYSSEPVLPGFFGSLSQQRGIRYKLYVIDNSPTDGGSALCRSLAARYGIDIKIKFNNANRGVAAGNNQGISAALADHCDLILLSNNDIEFGPITIAQLQSAVIEGKECVAVPKIMYYDRPDVLWYGGGRIDSWKGTTPHYGMGTYDDGHLDAQVYVAYAPTCFMLLDTSVFREIGTMDEQYFVYYDDADLIWRMGAAGIRIRYVPSQRVLHKVSSSTGGKLSSFTAYYGNRNRVYFIRKNLHGLQKAVALAYTLASRVPRFAALPPALARRGWRGIVDGFRMVPPAQEHGV